MDKKRVVVFAGNDTALERVEYYFPLAYKTGKLLAEAGFTVVTGGGPGLMNQVTKGAYEASGHTIGVCLELPGRKNSEYIREKFSFTTLLSRQAKLISLANGFLALPGGVGTFYEIFEVLARKRKQEISNEKKLILIDGYFNEFKALMGKMKTEGFVATVIDSMYSQVETPEEAVEMLSQE